MFQMIRIIQADASCLLAEFKHIPSRVLVENVKVSKAKSERKSQDALSERH